MEDGDDIQKPKHSVTSSDDEDQRHIVTFTESTESITTYEELVLLREEERLRNEEERCLRSSFPENSVSEFLAMAFAALLETCHNQLVLLGLPLAKHVTLRPLEYRSLEEKYADTRNMELYDAETMKPIAEEMNELESVKIQQDSYILQKLLRMAIKELKRDMCYSEMVLNLNDVQREMDEEEELCMKADVINETLNDLRTQTENEKEAMIKESQELMERVGRLKDNYEEDLVVTGVQMKYVDKWEFARCDANKYGLDFAEQTLTNKINDYTTKVDRDIRVDMEIQNYLNEINDDLHTDMELWIRKYEEDTEKYDFEIILLKEKLEVVSQRMMYLLALYQDHKQQIDEYLRFKQQLIEEKVENFRRKWAAKKIQAWWRRIMHRRGLGSHKKKPKSKDKKKKK